jgi:CubicO group peptidase (beta-lactamase class C family)
MHRHCFALPGLILCAGVGLMPPIASEDQWLVATPQSVGLDPNKLCALAARFEEWEEANLHGVVVVRHGKLAFEHYFRGFDLKARGGPGIIDFNATTTHDLRSMAKSVTALVLGVAIDRGIVADVDQSVLSFSRTTPIFVRPTRTVSPFGTC